MRELIRSHNLYHPIKHSGSEASVNLMMMEERTWSLIIFEIFEKLGGIEFTVEFGVIFGYFFELVLGYLMMMRSEILWRGVVDVFRLKRLIEFNFLVSSFVIVLLLVEGFAMASEFFHLFLKYFNNNNYW